MADDQEKLTPPEIKMATGVGEPPESIPIPAEPTPLPAAPTPPQPDFFSPETIGPTPIPEGVAKRGGGLKNVLVILGIIIFIGGFGSLAYFVIFPIIFPIKAPQPVQQQNPPVVTPVVLATHQSFLTKPPAAEAEIKLTDINYTTIATALQNESFNQLADGQFKEIKISDNGGQVPFSKYLASVAPATSALSGSDWFEDDFTAIFYYDASGVWPIYAAKLKAGTDPSKVAGGFKSLEKVLELSNFYLNPPGNFSAFKNGKAGIYPTRYSVGTQRGAAFNYGIFKNYLILSTNYNGLKASLPLLGL